MIGSFAVLAENKVIADCDVDAPDLHLLLHSEIIEREEFKGVKIAVMDKTLCTECGTCEETCRFNAIASSTEESYYAVNQARCEGCDLILIDGAPGIGCPVIASLGGVDLALIVTEPTQK